MSQHRIFFRLSAQSRGFAAVLTLLAVTSVGAEATDMPGALATADSFIAAIGQGNAAAARALLLPEVVIFESGCAEGSAAEYAARHLPADIEFMSGMKREVISRASGGGEDAIWVATRTRTRGRHHGKAVDLDSTETLALVRTGDGWRISHIHWSSMPHPAARKGT